MIPWQFALIALGAYLLGSVPFGLLLTRLAGLGDIRAIGSGNIGATNVLRTGRKGLAAVTLLLDAGKGAVAVLLARAIDPYFAAPAMVLVVLGHLFPPWLRFKGGKGVATAGGAILGLYWPVGLATGALWLLVVLITRLSSLGALLSAGGAPILTWVLTGDGRASLLVLVIAVLILFRHRGNIARLRRGEETRIF